MTKIQTSGGCGIMGRSLVAITDGFVYKKAARYRRACGVGNLSEDV